MMAYFHFVLNLLHLFLSSVVIGKIAYKAVACHTNLRSCELPQYPLSSYIHYPRVSSFLPLLRLFKSGEFLVHRLLQFRIFFFLFFFQRCQFRFDFFQFDIQII